MIDTMTVEADISTAPQAGLSTMPAEESTPAASGIATMLYPAAHQRFCTILRYVARARSTIAATSRGSERTSTMSADSMATSVPAPTAMPTSACVSAGASFTPSPVMATLSPRAWASLIFAA